MNLRRDYIYSFIVEPGRILTPACISEVEQGKIGRDVTPATRREVESFVAKRLLVSGRFSDTNYQPPISAHRVKQLLRWFEPGRLELLPNETQAVEYKMYFSTAQKDLIRYAKTMAAFANNIGGCILFGVSDDKKLCEFDERSFSDFDWQLLEEILDEYFGGTISFEHDIIYDDDLHVGVVFVPKSEGTIVMCRKSCSDIISEGTIYFRYSGKSRKIKSRELDLLIQGASKQEPTPISEEKAIGEARRQIERASSRQSRRTTTPDLFDED